MKSNQPDQGLLTAVMSAVHYFDIFHHPLRLDEIRQLLHHPIGSTRELENALARLTGSGHLFEKEGYYLPHNRFENIRRREAGAVRARSFWPVAMKKSELISRFPFVRAVLVSGSLSKNYMDDDSDIDYLIITHPGRLWISRTLLVLYKKLFLLNSHKFFCVNYFIDSDHLELPDRNLFTATELLFAKPTCNASLYRAMLEKNPWIRSYYPSFTPDFSYVDTVTPGNSRPGKFLESLLSGKTGDLADTVLMKLFKGYWKLKFRWMDRERFNRDMKSVKGVSKHHPNNFRDRIMNEHRERMCRLGALPEESGIAETEAVHS